LSGSISARLYRPAEPVGLINKKGGHCAALFYLRAKRGA